MNDKRLVIKIVDNTSDGVDVEQWLTDFAPQNITSRSACDPDCFALGKPWFATVPPPPCSSSTCPLMDRRSYEVTF